MSQGRGKKKSEMSEISKGMNILEHAAIGRTHCITYSTVIQHMAAIT